MPLPSVSCTITPSLPQVVSEYFGESEAGLRGIFAAAAALQPSVRLRGEHQLGSWAWTVHQRASAATFKHDSAHSCTT